MQARRAGAGFAREETTNSVVERGSISAGSIGGTPRANFVSAATLFAASGADRTRRHMIVAAGGQRTGADGNVLGICASLRVLPRR